MMELTIQEVAWAEKSVALMLVRETVFVQELGIPAAREQDGRDAEYRHWLVCDEHEEPIGTARMDPTGHIGRVAVIASHRGRGVGRRLMQCMLEDAAASGLAEVELNAQRHATDFYLKLGFETEGLPFEEAGIPHVRMRRQVSTP